FASTLSAQDQQLLALSKTALLPWLARTLKKPHRSLGERLRLAVVRRGARRAMGAARGTPGGEPHPTVARRLPRRGAPPPRRAAAVRRGPPASAEQLAQPITLYDYVQSPHARRIRILLCEKNLAWDGVEVDMHRMAHKAPAFLALNPNGELPALRHGERVLY